MLLTVTSGRSDDGLDEPIGRVLQGGYRPGDIQQVYSIISDFSELLSNRWLNTHPTQ